MHIATSVEQNFMYTAGATEMGRGERSNTLPRMNVPGPGAYNIYKEVKDPRARRSQSPEEEDEYHVNQPNYMITGKVHPIPRGPVAKDAPKTLREKWRHQPPDWKSMHDWSQKVNNVYEQTREQPEGWTMEKGLRTQIRDNKVPGPGAHYAKELPTSLKIDKEKAIHKFKKAEEKKPEAKDNLGPTTYEIKEAKKGPIFSFGSRFNSDIRSKEHLKPKKVDGPGPGDYQLPSSIRKVTKCASSQFDGTFGKGKREWSDLPKDNPSPTKYSAPMVGVPCEALKPHERQGFQFSRALRHDPQVELLHEQMKIVAPDRYYPNADATMRVGTSKQMLGKSNIPERKMNPDEPGPGQYNPPDSFKIAEQKIPRDPTVSTKPVQPQKKLTRDELEGIRQQQEENEKKQRQKCAHFGTSTREGTILQRFNDFDDGIRETHIPKSKFDDKGQLKMTVKYQGPPGPGAYNMTGDFDFRDPSKPEERIGKLPKGVLGFGIKPVERAKNLFVPGCGTYETHIINPGWIKKPISAFAGTSNRTEFVARNSEAYPGPGSHETEIPMGGPEISFPREIKNTTIEKTYAPGPASYVSYTTVGNAHGYLKHETNPRKTAVDTKQMQ